MTDLFAVVVASAVVVCREARGMGRNVGIRHFSEVGENLWVVLSVYGWF